jgi:ankyrin repeat protein
LALKTIKDMVSRKGLFAYFVTLVALLLPLSDHEIHKVAGEGDLDKVKAFLEKNTQLFHSKDENGRTPLHYPGELN